MKKLGVLLVFLLVGMFLFSGFVSAVDIYNGGSCHGSNSNLGGGTGKWCSDIPSCYGGHIVSECHYGSDCGSSNPACNWYFYCGLISSSCGGSDCVAVNGGWSTTSNGTWSLCNSSGQQQRLLTQTCNNPSPNSCGADCTTTLGWSRSGTTQTKNETQSCAFISQPFFSSLNQPNVNISSSNTGDTVLLRFPGASLTGTTINYSINVYNTSGAVWWNPFSYFSKAWDSSQKILGDAYEPFTLTQTNLHRFNASIVGTNQWNMSNNLTVSSVVNNSLPIAIINSPANDSKVQSGNLVWFNQSSTDEDDLLRITWDFGDGNITSCDNYSTGINSTQCDKSHTYTNKGIYTVKLTATEMTRGQSSQVMMLIYVFSSGINVVPIITNPKFGISYGNFVDFDASGSYVANCSTTSLIRNFTVANLNCTYVHAPNTPPSQSLNSYNLTYSWNMEGSSVIGNWSSYNSAVVFKYYFLNSGAHRTQLNLTYIGS